MAISFGDFTFDPDGRTLRRAGRSVVLTPRAFKLLETLLGRRPETVLRSELERQVWPDRFVAGGNLPNVMSELRGVLNDQKRPYKLLTTVHRVGYAFTGEAREVAPAQPQQAGFRLLLGDHEVRLAEGENWIGRSLECRVQLNCSKVSRKHARITVAGEKAILEDMGSRNGTFLCDQRLQAPSSLKNRDWINIGSVRLGVMVVHHDTPTDAD